MRCAVTFVAVDTNRPKHYRDDLRFMGVRVLNLHQLKAVLNAPAIRATPPSESAVNASSLESAASRGLWPCPFDVVLLSRRDAFKASYPLLQGGACEDIPIIFDTVRMAHLLRTSLV